MPKSKFVWTKLSRSLFIVLIGTISALVAIIAFFVGSPFERSKVTNLVQSQQIPGVPPAPPDIKSPALTENELNYGAESGCYPEGNAYTVILISTEKTSDSIYLNSFVLMDENRVQLSYYLQPGISNATSSYIPFIMIPGRRLRIKYAQCGVSGAIRILTYIESLPAIQH